VAHPRKSGELAAEAREGQRPTRVDPRTGK
jgi:hypothetical protein